MSKTLSFKGQLPVGLEDHIRLKTLKGKTGYRIKQFQIIGATPGVAAAEYVGKITKVKDPNISSVINFTDADLMAVSYTQETTSSSGGINQVIIFDNEITNQDIFVNITDASGATVACNYYIELETLTLTDIQSTQLTLKNLRTVASR
jgi:hypothetical protein